MSEQRVPVGVELVFRDGECGVELSIDRQRFEMGVRDKDKQFVVHHGRKLVDALRSIAVDVDDSRLY